jgi:hypothetical protein
VPLSSANAATVFATVHLTNDGLEIFVSALTYSTFLTTTFARVALNYSIHNSILLLHGFLGAKAKYINTYCHCSGY